MLAFWTVRADAFFDFTDTVGYFIGGGFAPVALLPGGCRARALFAPLTGRLSDRSGIGTVRPGSRAAAWRSLCLDPPFFGVYRVLWRPGPERYGAVGA